jgi:hypothetical protein
MADHDIAGRKSAAEGSTRLSKPRFVPEGSVNINVDKQGKFVSRLTPNDYG